jgi:hypothetical protein
MRRQEGAAQEDGLGAPGCRLCNLIGQQILAEVLHNQKEVVALFLFGLGLILFWLDLGCWGGGGI